MVNVVKPVTEMANNVIVNKSIRSMTTLPISPGKSRYWPVNNVDHGHKSPETVSMMWMIGLTRSTLTYLSIILGRISDLAVAIE